jgi:biotin carboxyl carrier protein
VTDLEVRVGGERVDPDADLTLTWVDRPAGVVRVHDGARSQLVLVEGTGSDWTVTIAGRRLPVSVQSWRERTLAEADVAARSHAGTLEVTASLPGLVVAIAVATGSEVAAGEPLLTIEAMKMQNEVRAPRDGGVGVILVAAGVAVATGQLLLRLD